MIEYMVERVARAMYEHRRLLKWDDPMMEPTTRQVYLEDARVAIAETGVEQMQRQLMELQGLISDIEYRFRSSQQLGRSMFRSIRGRYPTLAEETK